MTSVPFIAALLALVAWKVFDQELRDATARVARWLTVRSARHAPLGLRERYEEEWLAELTVSLDRGGSGLVPAVGFAWRYLLPGGWARLVGWSQSSHFSLLARRWATKAMVNIPLAAGGLIALRWGGLSSWQAGFGGLSLGVVAGILGVWFDQRARQREQDSGAYL